MISLQEILGKSALTDLTAEQQANIQELLTKINKIRTAWGKPMTVTSGFRSKEDHIRIYKAKGIDESKIPWGSWHLKGGAVDISDPKQELQAWCLANENKLAEIGLWCESFNYTNNWAHFQIQPPKSGKRFFNP